MNYAVISAVTERALANYPWPTPVTVPAPAPVKGVA